MLTKTIFAIDPGNIESGFAVIRMPDFKIIKKDKVENEELLSLIPSITESVDYFVIEMIDSYGMPVGKTVFDTCVWIGRFLQKAKPKKTHYIYRKDEKICLCGSLKAKDSNIRQALINRYAKFDFKNGKGLKGNPDTFYGVSKDMWQAIAVAVTFYETKEGVNSGKGTK